VTSSTKAIFFAPKTYYIKGHCNDVALEKKAAKGLPRRLVTANFYMDLFLGHDVAVPMPMLTRDTKTLAILDKQHAVRITKSPHAYPTFWHYLDITSPGFPFAFETTEEIRSQLLASLHTE
jgi:hypothetical protein